MIKKNFLINRVKKVLIFGFFKRVGKNSFGCKIVYI